MTSSQRVTIGGATLFHGDCLQVLPLLGPVDQVFTDPPYSSGGLHRSSRVDAPPSKKYRLSNTKRHYADFCGDNRDQRSYFVWSTLWLSLARERVRPGGLLGVFSDWRQVPITTDAIQAAGWIWRGIVPWDKGRGTRPHKGRFRAQAEYIIWGSNGSIPKDGPVLDGLFHHRVDPRERLHMAGKPVALMSDLLGLSQPGEVILDPFMGSASTGVAALQMGRRFVGIEAEPTYFETACRRIGDLGLA